MPTPTERIERIDKESKGVEAQCGIRSADRRFMDDVKARNQRSLSTGQEKWLADIERRVFGDEDDDES